MKITKQRIKDIIKEEMDLAGSESDLKKKMKELSNAISDDQVKIDPAEAEQIDKLITRIFSAGAAEMPSTAGLKKANDYITQYLKTNAITENALDETNAQIISKIIEIFNTRVGGLRKTKALSSAIKELDMADLNSNMPKTAAMIKDISDILSDDSIKVIEKMRVMREDNIDGAALKNEFDQESKQREPEEDEELETFEPLEFEEDEISNLQNNVANAQTSEDRLDVIATAAVQVADAKNLEPEEAAKAVVKAVAPDSDEEVVKAVADKAEEEAESPPEPEEIPEKLKQFQDSEFYNAIQDDQAKQGLSFIFKYFIDNQIISEGLKDVVIGLGIKPGDLRKALMKLKEKENDVFKKVVAFLKDENNTNAFIDAMKNFIPQSADAEEPAKEGEVEVEVGDREYTYTDENIQQLKTAYEAFEKGFMSAKNRVTQEDLWTNLRNALNTIGQFREIGRKERAYVEEQLINIFEQENQQNFKRIVVDIERLRRDLDDTDKTLKSYLEAAGKGQYESQAYLARFLAELKDVQNSVKRTAEDVQKVGGFKLNEQEEEAAEPKEETFEQKVAKVRGVYEKIKREFSETLPQLDQTLKPELEEFSGRIKDAYDQLESIRYLFSRVGAFAKTSDKDVDELQQDYTIAKEALTKSMSRALSDLRAGEIKPDQLKTFLTRLLGVADWISTNFGVGPDEQYRVQGVTIQSDGKDKEEVAQDTDDSGGQALTPEGSEKIDDPQDARTEVDPEATTLADPTELMTTEIPDLSREIVRHAPKRGPVRQDIYASLVEKDEQFSDYYSRFLALLSGINRMSKIPEEEPAEIRKSLQLLWKSLSGEIREAKEDDEKPSIFRLQQLTYLMFKLLESFSNQTTEKDMQKFYILYQKALILVRTLKNVNNDLVFLDNDDFVNTVLNNTEYFTIDPSWRSVPTEIEESKSLLERLIKKELKVLNGKKMVRN